MERRVLLTWELGSGWGHLAVLRPLARSLTASGWTVVAAVREIKKSITVLSGDVARILAGPRGDLPMPLFPRPRNFAEILANIGYTNSQQLLARVDAWAQLLADFQSHCVICDFSPTALLAARCLRLPAVVVGNGFSTPPDESPLPLIREPLAAEVANSSSIERAVLETINLVAKRWSAPPLTRVSELMHNVALNALTTFVEIDHYRSRSGQDYFGSIEDLPGIPLDWSRQSSHPRIFVYLQRFSMLRPTLEELAGFPAEFLVYLAGLSEGEFHNLASEKLRYVRLPVDIRTIANACDACICHGGHGTTTAMLLAGKPILFMPRWQEQQLTAERVIEMRAGLGASIQQPQLLRERLHAIVYESTYADRARTFAAKYAQHNSAEVVEQIVGFLRDQLP